MAQIEAPIWDWGRLTTTPQTTNETKKSSWYIEAQQRRAQWEVIQWREQDKNDFEIITEWMESEVLNKIKSTIHLYVESEFSQLKIGNEYITQQQKNNICLALTGKLLNSGIENFISLTVGDKIERFQQYAQEQDWMQLVEDWFEAMDEEKEWSEWKKNIIETTIQKAIIGLTTPIKKVIESQNPSDEQKKKFLANPKYMENYKDGDNLVNIPRVENDNIPYLTNLKLKVKNLDEKFKNTDEMKEIAFDFIAHMPKKLQGLAKDILNTLCSIPFIWDIVKTLLGIDGENEDEILTWLDKEIKRRKSVMSLRQYWKQFNKENWVWKLSTKIPWIETLKDKDLREIKSYKLKAFFLFCETNQIDIGAKDFWEKAFSNQLKTTEGKDIIIENLHEDSIFTLDKPNDSFYTRLNAIKIKETPASWHPPIAPTTPEAQAIQEFSTWENIPSNTAWKIKINYADGSSFTCTIKENKIIDSTQNGIFINKSNITFEWTFIQNEQWEITYNKEGDYKWKTLEELNAIESTTDASTVAPVASAAVVAPQTWGSETDEPAPQEADETLPILDSNVTLSFDKNTQKMTLWDKEYEINITTNSFIKNIQVHNITRNDDGKSINISLDPNLKHLWQETKKVLDMEKLKEITEALNQNWMYSLTTDDATLTIKKIS